MNDHDDHDVWESHAAWWQEGYSEGADVEYSQQIVPMLAERISGSDRVLDLGTGEGQLARVARDAGASMIVGVDRSWAQVLEATNREADATGVKCQYIRADACELPFAAESFDAVIASLVFEHVADLDTAISEVARVLSPGGRLMMFVNHPLMVTPNSGWIDDQILEEQYYRIGPYLNETTTIEEVEVGVKIPFHHRPMSRYINAFSRHGLLVTEMVEPSPPGEFLFATSPDSAAVPRLMFCVLTFSDSEVGFPVFSDRFVQLKQR